ncbi:MAG: SLC13 family permease [Planctomycetota bacterium]
MTWEAWLTLATVVTVFVALLRNWAPTDVVMMAGLTVLVLAGELLGTKQLPGANDAVAGLGNSGLITVALLFVVVAGLSQTGAMNIIAGPLLGRPKSVGSAQLRLLTPVMLLSAFLNNTPVVAMFMPVVEDICKRTRISPSKLYLPLAYAATFGGVCTLVGTSTNLIVNGLLIEATGTGLKMFDLSWVGIPAGAAAITYLLLASRWLLPDRQPAITLHDDPRQYTVEMIVQDAGPLVGKSVEEAALRHLPGLFLVEIERAGELIAAVSSRQRLHGGDRLVFVGLIESVVDLHKMRGLTRAAEAYFQIETPQSNRRLIEAVVSDRCPLVGTTIRDGQFRTTYDAAVVGVARGSRRVAGKIGDIVLQAGDTLLLEADQDFISRERNSSHFFLISGVENSERVRHDRAWVAIAVLVGMVATVAVGGLNLLTAALVASGLMLALKCCSIGQARQSVDWPLLVVIAASLGMGKAIESSGLAGIISSEVIDLAGGHPWLALLAVYFVTTVLTEFITNNAAAVLVFPIAMATAKALDVNAMPFVVAITVAASAGFATPFGYQTNLMVYSAGGYRFSDYLRLGIPLNILFMIVTVAIAPLVWPFHN